jgi:hypothetical protein
MPAPVSYAPVIRVGALPTYDLDETLETGLLTESIKFTPISEVRKKMAHVSPTAIAQTVQTRTINSGLQLDYKGSIIPAVDGTVQGLASSYVGQCIICLHFSDAGAESIVRHGYSRDSTKALQVTEISTDLGNTNPADVSFKAEYLPYVVLAA